MSQKQKYPAAVAQQIADALLATFESACERIAIAGSLRRRRAEVGDIELVYVPRYAKGPVAGDMFAIASQNQVDALLVRLTRDRVLERRLTVKGNETYGDRIKLMRHVPSGIPVDFFSIPAGSWWNYLVCRTGPKESNEAICCAAIEKGWKWEPYSSGFVQTDGLTESALPNEPARRFAVTCERDVFEFVGLPYREPEARV